MVRIRAYRDGDPGAERDWHVDIGGQTIDFRHGDEALRAARMLAGPGCLLVIDRRTEAPDTGDQDPIPQPGD